MPKTARPDFNLFPGIPMGGTKPKWSLRENETQNLAWTLKAEVTEKRRSAVTRWDSQNTCGAFPLLNESDFIPISKERLGRTDSK